MRHILAIIVLLGAVDGIYGAATGSESKPVDADRGRAVFAVCAACHREATAGVPNPGPDLRGVFGRAAGSVPGYRYSRALRNAKRIWDETTLGNFIADPQAAVPGNTMPFPGLPDDAQRRDLVAFLKTLK
jgi:cytochrome c